MPCLVAPPNRIAGPISISMALPAAHPQPRHRIGAPVLLTLYTRIPHVQPASPTAVPMVLHRMAAPIHPRKTNLRRSITTNGLGAYTWRRRVIVFIAPELVEIG